MSGIRDQIATSITHLQQVVDSNQPHLQLFATDPLVPAARVALNLATGQRFQRHDFCG